MGRRKKSSEWDEEEEELGNGKRCKYTPRDTLPDPKTIDAILHFDEAAMLSAISG